MNKKKVIIVIVFTLLILAVIYKNQQNTAAAAQQQAQEPQTIKDSKGNTYVSDPSGSGKQIKDQTTVTLTPQAIDYLSDRINSIYEQWLYDWELEELNDLLKTYIHTDADIETIFQAVPKWRSWIQIQKKDGFRPYFSESKESTWIAKFNKTLKIRPNRAFAIAISRVLCYD